MSTATSSPADAPVRGRSLRRRTAARGGYDGGDRGAKARVAPVGDRGSGPAGTPPSPPILLCAPETFDLAETTRMLEVAQACRDRFQVEFMCYGGQFARLIHEAGFTCHCLAPNLTPRRIEELGLALRMERGGRMFTADELITRIESELQLYRDLRPVAIVTGFILSAYVSARAAGIPLVTVAPLAVTRPFFEARLCPFPDQFEIGPLRLVPRGWRDAATNWWGLHTRQWLGPFNEAARTFGVKPFRRLVDLVEADEMLITNVPEIAGLADLPPHWRYVGPIYAHLDGETPPTVLDLPRDRPLVYFSLGSLPNLAILDRFIVAFGRLPVRVIAPIGAHVRGRRVAVPPNVHVFDWLPAHKVCPLVDVAVIHGGEGTVQTVCASGLPFVGVGLTPEQDANIEFLVRRGTAVRLNRRDINSVRLGSALERLLTPDIRLRAAELREVLRDWDGPANVARFLARYAVPSAPVRSEAPQWIPAPSEAPAPSEVG